MAVFDKVVAFWLLKNVILSIFVEIPVCRIGPTWAQHADENALLKFSLEQLVKHNADPLFVNLPNWIHEAVCVHAWVFAPLYALLAVALLMNWKRIVSPVATFLGGMLTYAMLYVTVMELRGTEYPTLNPVMWGLMNLDYFLLGIILFVRYFPWSALNNSESTSNNQKKKQ